jgi:hypothetical protein
MQLTCQSRGGVQTKKGGRKPPFLLRTTEADSGAWPSQVLALKRLSIDQLTVWALDYLDAAISAPLQKQRLDDGGLSIEFGGLGIASVGVPVTNPPIGHLRIPLSGECHYCAIERRCQAVRS